MNVSCEETRAMFQKLFDYDLWANLRWLEIAPKLKGFARAHELLNHIQSAEEIWLKRCGHGLPEGYEKLSQEDQWPLLVRAWQELVSKADLDANVAYTNLRGEPFTSKIVDMTLQVISHGSYERGHLRGLCEAEGYMDFHETDYIQYCREHCE